MQSYVSIFLSKMLQFKIAYVEVCTSRDLVFCPTIITHKFTKILIICSILSLARSRAEFRSHVEAECLDVCHRCWLRL